MKLAGIRWIALACLAACASAGVPESPPVRVLGVVEGTVSDSVRRLPLAGAYVELRPSGRQVTTDAAGRFRIADVPANQRYSLAAFHPLLDTIGVAVASLEFTVTSGTNVMSLATPPAARLVTMLCPADQTARGPAAVIGFVRYMDSGTPVDSATVTLTFADGSVTRTDVPDAAGRFRFCGLPEQTEARVQLTRKGVRTEWEAVGTSAGSPLALRSLGFPRTPGKPPV